MRPNFMRTALALLVGGGWMLGCSPEQKPGGATPPTSANEDGGSLPQVGGPEGYTGSKACQNCHKDQFASWHRSFHRTMTQFAHGEAVQADFSNVVLTNADTRFTLQRRGDEHWVRMQKIGEEIPPDGEAFETRISLVTGSHHMQVFWVPEGHGNLQVGFPFTWLIPEKRWVPRESTFIRPPGTEHRPEAWNIVCSRCHTTGVEPHADMSARRIETQVAELGISCEACHGPGQRHTDLQNAAQASGRKSPLLAGEIVHPEKLSPERASQVCGFCHSMKWIDRAEHWREKGFRFRPGDDLQASTPVIRPGHLKEIPGLEEYLGRHPDLLRDFFWSDGMMRVSGREYNGLIESPCAKGGKFSCLSCHSPHDSEPDDQLRQIGKSNAACVQCHEKFRDDQAVAAHTHHLPSSTGSACYNCHMPHTTYGVLKAIRSHQISSPRVAEELTTGRPNACNLCHVDKTLGWTAESLTRWYGQPAVTVPREWETLPHIPRLAVAGDAGQRALAAWHLGWSPALAAAGNRWALLVLPKVLDDPYAAVRCVAERALRGVAAGTVPTGYNYTKDPRERVPWTPIANPATSPELARESELILEWIARRKEAPIRLRE